MARQLAHLVTLTSYLRYPTMVRQLAFYTTHTHADGLLHAWDSSKWDFLGDWITPHGSESNVITITLF